MPELLLVVFAILALYAITAGQRFGHLSVISLFVYAQATMAAGTIPALDATLEADHLHAALIILTFSTLVLVSIACAFATREVTRRTYDPDVNFTYPRRSVAFWIVLSIAISAGYYLSIGYVAFFESLQSLATDTGEDLSGLRLESYAGSRYFFPGYVNQFKNSLLPALTIVVLVSAYHFRKRGRTVMALFLVPVALIALLGTGQRGAFVIAMALTVIAAYYITPPGFSKYALRIGLLGISLFFITTVASGRATTRLREASGIGEQIGILFEQLSFRLLGSNQTSSIVGFRYVHDQDISFGGEWWQSIVGLLPGQPGSDLSNRIFAVLYGSTRGTAPLSLWGSAFHNFGLVGAVTIAALIAFAFCRIATAINDTKKTNLIQIVGMSGITVTLGTWIASGPTSALNAGFVVYLLSWFWGSRIEKRRHTEPSRRKSFHVADTSPARE